MGAKSREVNRLMKQESSHFWDGGTKEVNDVTEVQSAGTACSPARAIASARLNTAYSQLVES